MLLQVPQNNPIQLTGLPEGVTVTLANGGPGTVYYGGPNITPANATGSIAPGTSATIDGRGWYLIASAPSTAVDMEFSSSGDQPWEVALELLKTNIGKGVVTGIATSGGAPSVVSGGSAGQSPTTTITGVDSVGQILIVPDVGAGVGDQVVVTFGNPFTVTPAVCLTPANINASLVDYLVDNVTPQGFSVGVASIPEVGLPGLALLYNYLVVGVPSN